MSRALESLARRPAIDARPVRDMPVGEVVEGVNCRGRVVGPVYRKERDALKPASDQWPERIEVSWWRPEHRKWCGKVIVAWWQPMADPPPKPAPRVGGRPKGTGDMRDPYWTPLPDAPSWGDLRGMFEAGPEERRR